MSSNEINPDCANVVEELQPMKEVVLNIDASEFSDYYDDSKAFSHVLPMEIFKDETTTERAEQYREGILKEEEIKVENIIFEGDCHRVTDEDTNDTLIVEEHQNIVIIKSVSEISDNISNCYDIQTITTKDSDKSSCEGKRQHYVKDEETAADVKHLVKEEAVECKL